MFVFIVQFFGKYLVIVKKFLDFRNKSKYCLDLAKYIFLTQTDNYNNYCLFKLIINY